MVFDRVIPIITALGARIIHELTLSEFGNLFANKNIDVVILFSHWNENTVEFYDGLYEVSVIVQKVPPEFGGIIDLCVCHPERLAIELRQERPRCLTRYANNIATPSFWLYFYLALFRFLSDCNLTYLSALEKTVDSFLTNKRS